MARKSRAPEASAEDDVNLTPMLDFVFILLIFFIVTAQFIQEPDVEPERVSVETLKSINPLGIIIAIDENDEIHVGKKIVPLSEVSFRIRELREDNPQGRLIIQADANSKAGVFIDLMQVVNDVEGKNIVNISAIEK
jgi:biopolymer transport protein ExbD